MTAFFRFRGPSMPNVEAIDAGRISMITTAYGGRPALVPQSYYDAVAVEAEDPNMHPSLGPFTHVAIADGPWSDVDTWDTGTVPNANAVVNVGAFHVVYDVESNTLIKDIHIGGAGTLEFDTSLDTRLWVDTIMCHGTFICGQLGDPMLNSSTAGKPRCEIVFWASEAPLATVRLGLVCMGPVRILAAEMATRLWCSVDPTAGATVLTLEELASANWRVGDTVVVVATTNAGVSATDAQYTGPTQFFGATPSGAPTEMSLQKNFGFSAMGFRLSHDEERTITAVGATTITLSSALTHAHPGVTRTLPHGEVVTLKCAVANMCGSVRFRSPDSGDLAIWPDADLTDLQKRAHTMFMHDDNVDARYAEGKNMCRTDTNPSLFVSGLTLRATDGGVVITDPNNVRGRYAWHSHWAGPYFARRQVVFKGLRNWAPQAEVPQPGWGNVSHHGRTAVEDCVGYNQRGAIFVWELGSEIGQGIRNTAIWARGDGFAAGFSSRAEMYQNHNGHHGVGFESQARQILQQGNLTSSCHTGWAFMMQAVNEMLRIPDEHSLRLFDSITQGGNTTQGGQYALDFDTYGIEQSQIPDFYDNLAYGCGKWFTVAHRGFTERLDTTPAIFRRCHCLNTDVVFNLINYSFFYSFYDFLWIGGTTGASLGSVSWQFMFVNGRVEDFDTGFRDAGILINYNGYWIDIDFVNVTEEYHNIPEAISTSADATAHPAYGHMGPWTITDPDTPDPGYTAIVRTWETLDSVTDLPVNTPLEPWGTSGVEPAPGTPKPYFELDPSSDTTIVAGYIEGQLNIFGVLVDNVGVRRYPDWQTAEGAMINMSLLHGGRVGNETTGEELVLRNGCYEEGGTWLTKLWLVEHDRLTGNYFQIPVPCDLVGFDAGFLADNTIDPVAPVLPLLPEVITPVPLVADTTGPTINMAANYSVLENRTLAILLRSDDGHADYEIGGTDAANVEIEDGYITWASDGVMNYEAPTDAGGNNVHNLTVTGTDQFGNAGAAHPFTITVLDEVEGATTFSDDFTGTDGQFVTDRLGFELIVGDQESFYINTNRMAIDAAGETLVLLPDIGSANQKIGAKFMTNGGVILLFRYVDEDNYLRFQRHNSTSTMRVDKMIAGVLTLNVAVYGNYSADPVSAEISGTTLVVRRNGVVQTITSGSNTIADAPAGTRAALYVASAVVKTSALDTLTWDAL